uniref:neuron navigator 2-like isoform X2 n=1 Tax=Myxine glutinosa TaxID=7769 RepID=UPI00358E0557
MPTMPAILAVSKSRPMSSLPKANHLHATTSRNGARKAAPLKGSSPNNGHIPTATVAAQRVAPARERRQRPTQQLPASQVPVVKAVSGNLTTHSAGRRRSKTVNPMVAPAHVSGLEEIAGRYRSNGIEFCGVHDSQKHDGPHLASSTKLDPKSSSHLHSLVEKPCVDENATKKTNPHLHSLLLVPEKLCLIQNHMVAESSLEMAGLLQCSEELTMGPNRYSASMKGDSNNASRMPGPRKCQVGTRPKLEKAADISMAKQDLKIYTDWANHYLAKSGHRRLIRDLQQDVGDGVLLAEIIHAVANDKVDDINCSPKSQPQMIQNITACLNFLASKGVNIQGLSAEEIQHGNLKAILSLFFSLSRYKQQQQQQQLQQQQQKQLVTTGPAAAAKLAGNTQQTSMQQKSIQDMQSRLPAPASRATGSVCEAKGRGVTGATSNRRSQSFNVHEKAKVASPSHYDAAESVIQNTAGMNGSAMTAQGSVIPQAGTGSGAATVKSWRGKPTGMKHTSASTVPGAKAGTSSTETTDLSRVVGSGTASGGQRSVLEKFRLFNSLKAGSKAEAGVAEDIASAEASDSSEATPGVGSSPKIALKGIAQRTISRALNNNRKVTGKLTEKEKSKTTPVAMESVKVIEAQDCRTDVGTEAAKKSSKIASFIPKGGKTGTGPVVKKEGTPAATGTGIVVGASGPGSSGIPKPGTKSVASKSVVGHSREGERTRPTKTTAHAPQIDAKAGLSGLSSAEGSGTRPLSGGTIAAPVGVTSPSSGLPVTMTTSTTQTTGINTVGVQLPHPQQQYNHPNMATVAPFLYRTHMEGDGSMPLAVEAGPSTGPSDSILFNKSMQQSPDDLSGEDPEVRRMRTVKNIADLRQNLEETMSSLRGTQITHSTLETTFDSSVTTEVSGRGMGGRTTATAPRSWRLAQAASPRLQAGDAPSLGNGYPPRANANRFAQPEATGVAAGPPATVGRFLRRGPCPSGQVGVGSTDSSERKEDIGMPAIGGDVAGYMSDGDVLGKSLRGEEMPSGYMTDGGLSLYSRRLHRRPDGLAAMRDTVPLAVGDADSWDDDSSISSGLSDTIDNVSTDDIHTSSSVGSHPTTPATARRKGALQHFRTDNEKHCMAENHGSWCHGSILDDVKISGSETETGGRMESSNKWKRNPTDMSDESERSCSGLKRPGAIGSTGSWRRGMTAQSGIIPSRVKGTSSSLKTPGKTDDAKASEQGHHSPKPSQVQRSPSDAGRSSGDEGRKPPSGIARPSGGGGSVASSFGFKRPTGGSIMTASGAMVISGSATVGKLGRAGIAGRAGTGRKASVDGCAVDESFLPTASRATLTYRSLPRPAKSSGGRGTGNRSSTSSIDSNLSSKSAGCVPGSKLPSRIGVGHSSPPTAGPPCSTASPTIPPTTTQSHEKEPGHSLERDMYQVNQTDREKAAAAAAATPADSCISNIAKVGTGQAPCPTSPTQVLAKGPDIASPTLRRLFGGKVNKQQQQLVTDCNKTSTNILSHTGLVRRGSSDSPSPLGSSRSASPAPSPGLPAFPGPNICGPKISTPSNSAGHCSTPNGGPWSPGVMVASPPSCKSQGSMIGPTSGEMGMLSGGVLCPPILFASPATGAYGLANKVSESQSPFVRTNSIKSTMSERCAPSQQRAQDEWLRSHSIGGLQDTGEHSPLNSAASITSPTNTRFHFPPPASPNTAQFSMSFPNVFRSNSVSTHEPTYEMYGDTRLRNSSASLDERHRGISRSASFRDGVEEVHGSSLSLVSSTSSVYSTTDEKSVSEMKKLRRELDASQEKVATLTAQLTTNAHLVAAFEQSLANMTSRLQSLTMSAEQKDSELNELRKTIEMLKRQNAAAQAAISGVINTPEPSRKGSASSSQSSDARMRRQHSSDSVSSINSATSHSSMGSCTETPDARKKKKKNWVNTKGSKLRSSFKQAFGKKKSPKSASSHSDIEEMTTPDSSLPSSPKLPHNNTASNPSMIKPSHSASAICESAEPEAEKVIQLRGELREKEMKLTDIRLEALSSAHQLDQLREAMNHMQGEIEKLKTENDRLKSDGTGNCTRAQSQHSISSTSSPRQSVGLSQHSLNLPESPSFDMLIDDGDGSLRKDRRNVKIVVAFDDTSKRREDTKPLEYLVGSIGVSGKTKWDVLDGVVRRLFKEYLLRVDPLTNIGLNSDSVLSYHIGDLERSRDFDVPELLPCGYLVGENTTICLSLKGQAESSLDSLVFETLIPKAMLQRYVSLLTEHRRIILSGPSGTGKTYLANRLAEYIVRRSGREVSDGIIATFNVDHKSSKELRQYLLNLADQCSNESNAADLPLVIILDNLHHIGSLGEIFNGFLSCKFQKCSYIIGTMNQAVASTPNLQLHHNFRWVLCANHVEPVNGFLSRYLRRKLVEMEIETGTRNNDLNRIIDWMPKAWNHLNRFLEAHSSSDVTIGPRLFLSCPMDVDGSRVWFTDLWNYSIIPYLLEAVREGLQLYGRRSSWEDPAKWVMETYPWSSPQSQHEWPTLLQLRPEDVGFDGYSSSKEGGGPSKQLPQSDAEGDPLMNMLMRLQEAANCSSPQSCDSDSNSTSHHDDVLDSSLESSL